MNLSTAVRFVTIIEKKLFVCPTCPGPAGAYKYNNIPFLNGRTAMVYNKKNGA
jgi:hypothetical protein